jgi:glycosyltransferase involved in cell wall biosynthesis
VTRVCVVTPFHVSFQPRALREADCLQEAGYAVRVVSVRADPALDPFDNELLESRRWQHASVDLVPGRAASSRRLLTSARLRVAQRASQAGIVPVWLAAHAALRGSRELERLGCREPADLFIAHTQGALAATAAAARRFGAPMAFDCEDLLGERRSPEAAAVRTLEGHHIGRCRYVSVPAITMAAHLRSRYSLRSPIVVLENVPHRLPSGLRPPRERSRGGPLKLHWFGQTAGMDRGLEDAARALVAMREPAELHILGESAPDVRAALWRFAGSAANRVMFHARVSPDHLLETVARYDVGLATERPDHPSCSLTLSNKLFGYMAAGLAVVASDTPGQRELFDVAPAIGFMYAHGDATGLAKRLDSWACNRASLLAAQEASWLAGHGRFSWTAVSRRFLHQVESAIAGSGAAAS